MISYKKFLENKKIAILIELFASSWLWLVFKEMSKHNCFKWANQIDLRIEWVKRNLGI